MRIITCGKGAYCGQGLTVVRGLACGEGASPLATGNLLFTGGVV
jgi:hypothetical protein